MQLAFAFGDSIDGNGSIKRRLPFNDRPARRGEFEVQVWDGFAVRIEGLDDEPIGALLKSLGEVFCGRLPSLGRSC